MATSQPPTRLTVLISGSGTNLQALIDASTSTPPTLPNTQIIRVLSDRKSAYGLTRAQNANIPSTYFPWLPYKKAYPDNNNSSDPTSSEARQKYDAALAEEVLKDSPQMIVCAGFMRILTPSFLDPIVEKGIPIINLHPSLPGDLVGAGCIERAWEEFEKKKRTKTGVMVHYVIREVDLGEPIVWEEVDMRGCEKMEDLVGRVREKEHGIIVEGARRVVEGLRRKQDGI
ncbi:unnamed protein product [Cercospora beticola]|nr:unnamed protein product [Cercospora beticola]